MRRTPGPVNVAAFCTSLTASCLTVLISGILAARLQDWFGASDLEALVIWFAPPGLIAAAGTALWFHTAVRWSLPARYAVGIVVGPTLGFLWTYSVARLLGPLWGAMSLPALMCWMAGSISGVIGGLVLGPGSSARTRIATIAGLATLASAGVLSSRPLFIWLSHDQTLTVRFLRWTPGSAPLVFESEREDGPSGVVTALIRQAKPRGRARLMWGGGADGEGPPAAAYILLTRPITDPVTLRQPDRTTVLYVQDDERFARYPAGVPTLDREIMLSRYEDGVWCAVRDANGGVSGSPVRIW